MSNKSGKYSAENIEKILSKPVNIRYLEKRKPGGYDYTYDILLELFECLMKQQDKKKWLIGGTSLVYSWMPTILEFRMGSETDALSSLHKIREIINHKDNYFAQDDNSIEEQLEPLRDFINNAIVGPSKFLHFSFPKVFPIWDKRVESVFPGKPSPHRLTKSNSNSDIGYYIEYARSVHQVCKTGNSLANIKHIKLFNGKSPVRKIEQALFLIGGKKKKK